MIDKEIKNDEKKNKESEIKRKRRKKKLRDREYKRKQEKRKRLKNIDEYIKGNEIIQVGYICGPSSGEYIKFSIETLLKTCFLPDKIEIIIGNNCCDYDFSDMNDIKDKFYSFNIYNVHSDKKHPSHNHGDALDKLFWNFFNRTYGMIVDSDIAFLRKNWDIQFVKLINSDENIAIIGPGNPVNYSKFQNFPSVYCPFFFTNILKECSITWQPLMYNPELLTIEKNEKISEKIMGELCKLSLEKSYEHVEHKLEKIENQIPIENRDISWKKSEEACFSSNMFTCRIACNKEYSELLGMNRYEICRADTGIMLPIKIKKNGYKGLFFSTCATMDFVQERQSIILDNIEILNTLHPKYGDIKDLSECKIKNENYSNLICSLNKFDHIRKKYKKHMKNSLEILLSTVLQGNMINYTQLLLDIFNNSPDFNNKLIILHLISDILFKYKYKHEKILVNTEDIDNKYKIRKKMSNLLVELMENIITEKLLVENKYKLVRLLEIIDEGGICLLSGKINLWLKNYYSKETNISSIPSKYTYCISDGQWDPHECSIYMLFNIPKHLYSTALIELPLKRKKIEEFKQNLRKLVDNKISEITHMSDIEMKNISEEEKNVYDNEIMNANKNKDNILEILNILPDVSNIDEDIETTYNTINKNNLINNLEKIYRKLTGISKLYIHKHSVMGTVVEIPSESTKLIENIKIYDLYRLFLTQDFDNQIIIPFIHSIKLRKDERIENIIYRNRAGARESEKRGNIDPFFNVFMPLSEENQDKDKEIVLFKTLETIFLDNYSLQDDMPIKVHDEQLKLSTENINNCYEQFNSVEKIDHMLNKSYKIKNIKDLKSTLSDNFIKNCILFIEEKIVKKKIIRYISLSSNYLEILEYMEENINKCLKDIILYNIINIKNNRWEIKSKLSCNLNWLRNNTKYNDTFVRDLLISLNNLEPILVKLQDLGSHITIEDKYNYSMKNYYEVFYKNELYLTHLGQSSGREFNIDPLSKLWIKNVKNQIGME